MEMLNKVELAGRVGNARVQTVGNTRVCRFSLATDRAFTDRNGNQILETTWHQCQVWGNDEKMEGIQKGAAVSLTGRLRNYKYTAADGTERTGTEILVVTFNIINE